MFTSTQLRPVANLGRVIEGIAVEIIAVVCA
jgi:hypothetical protein